VSLRYAVLALLAVEPMTGYDLQKQFGTSVGNVWHAPDSQIYPELRKMERDGLLEGEEVPWGSRGKKRLYHITDDGRSALEQWMNEPAEYARVRDPAYLKAAYLEYATPEAARRHFTAHIEHHSRLLSQFEQQLHEIDERSSIMLNKRLAGADPDKRHQVQAFKRFAYEGLTLRAQQEISWASRGLRLLDRLYPGADPAGETTSA